MRYWLAAGLAVAIVAYSEPARSIDPASLCENLIKSSLKAPATYSRISVGTGSDRITDYTHFRTLLEKGAEVVKGMAPETANAWFVEYAKTEEFKKRLAHAVERGKAPWAVIIYDAQNSFGALLRGRVQCEFIDEDGDGDVTIENVTAIYQR